MSFLPIAFVAAMPIWAWAAFFMFIIAMLALDLGVFQRDAHEMKMREALTWCAVWLCLALAFNAGLWFWRGPEAGQQFLAAYPRAPEFFALKQRVDPTYKFRNRLWDAYYWPSSSNNLAR